MRHVWIRNYRCISQCVEQTADRVHGVADPSFGPAVVQHGGLLVGTAAPGAAAVAAVGALGVTVPGRTAATATAAAADHAASAHTASTTATDAADATATSATAATAGHETAGCPRRRMIVVVRAIAVAPWSGAYVGSGGIRERGAPVTGAARAAGRVSGPRVVVPASGQTARGRQRRGRRTTAATRRRGRGRRGHAVRVAAAAYHWARDATRRARPRLRVRVVRTRLGRPELVAPGRRVRMPGRAPGRWRFLALLPPALRVQLLLLHGAHHAHGQPQSGRMVPVRPECVHAGRARGQRLVPQRLTQRVETARLRAVRYVTAIRVAEQYVLQVHVVPRHAHCVQGSAKTRIEQLDVT